MRKPFRNAALAAVLVLACLAVLLPSRSLAVEPSRRIAVAPFQSVGPDDVRPVAGLLPRLLASRLMALAGVDAPVLSADKPVADAAKESGAALLLQGTVARLGKGYSIDVTVLDLAAGKQAGAFFAAPASEDDIIPQVGRLSEEIAAKLFDVRPAPRPQAATAAPVPAPAYAPAPAAGVEAPPAGKATPAAAPGAWSPSALRKAGQSDKVTDELFGIVSLHGGAGAEGELVAWGKTTLYFYRVKDGALLPWTRISRELNHHFLNVEATDLDGDGVDEILVTDRASEKLQSFVLKRKGDVYEEIAEDLPWYLVVLPDRKGRREVVGQAPGLESPFQGRFVALEWNGKALAEGNPLPLPASTAPMSTTGVLGLSAARVGDADRFFFTEEAGYVRVLDDAGKTLYKSKTKYGAASDSFEWGPFLQLEGRRASVGVRQGPRVIPFDGGRPLLLVPQLRKAGVLSRISGGETDGSRLVLLQWEDGELVEKAGSKPTDFFLTGADLVPASLSKGALVAAAVIEQPAGVFKDRISRIALYAIE